jgi:UDP-glucose 4-epimerase
LRNNQTFTLYGDGKQERDFIYVADVVKALILLLQSDAKHKVYNVATGKTNSLLEVIHEMEEIAGRNLKMTMGPERTGDIKYSQADISELGKLGFVADNNLAIGLEKYLKYEKI